MPATTSAEIGVRELRAQMSEVLNETAVRGRITYVTSRGHRVAAVVPVPLAEQLEKGARDAHALESLKAAVDGLPDGEKAPFVARWFEQMTGTKLPASD